MIFSQSNSISSSGGNDGAIEPLIRPERFDLVGNVFGVTLPHRHLPLPSLSPIATPCATLKKSRTKNINTTRWLLLMLSNDLSTLYLRLICVERVFYRIAKMGTTEWEERKQKAHIEWTNEQNHLTDKANMRYSASDATMFFCGETEMWHSISSQRLCENKIKAKLIIYTWIRRILSV